MAVEIRGLEQLVEQWDKAPELVREELTAAATKATMLLEREVVDVTPVGVYGGAGLSGSISSQVQQLPKGVTGIVGSNSPYAIPVELGTRPHFPPIDQLVDWVKAKLGVDGAEARGVAFLVARKISVKGTKGQHMFSNTFDAQKDYIQSVYENSQIRIVEQLSDV